MPTVKDILSKPSQGTKSPASSGGFASNVPEATPFESAPVGAIKRKSSFFSKKNRQDFKETIKTGVKAILQKASTERDRVDKLPFAQAAKEDLIKKPAKIIKTVAQGILGGMSYLGKSAIEAVAGEEERKKFDQPEIEQKIYGYQPTTLQQFTKKAGDFAVEKGATPFEKRAVQTGAFVGSLFLESPLGPKKGAFKEIFEGILEKEGKVSNATFRELVRESDPQKVKNFLEFKKVPAEDAKILAEPLANARTISQVKDILSKHAEGPVAKPSSVKQILQKAEEKAAPLGLTKTDDPLENLALEARKYKSAEEFVAAQAQKPFGGAPSKTPPKEIPKVGSIVKTNLTDAEYKVIDVVEDRLTIQRKGASSTFQVGVNEITKIIKGGTAKFKPRAPTNDAIQGAEVRYKDLFFQNDFESLTDFYNKTNKKPSASMFPKVKALNDALEKAKAGTSDFGPQEPRLARPRKVSEPLPDTTDITPEERVTMERASQEMKVTEANKEKELASEIKAIRETGRNKEELKAELEQDKLGLSFEKEALDQNPAKPLGKYENRRTGELPEVLGRVDKKAKGIFRTKGDDISTQMGFADSETAREAYQQYKVQRARFKEQKDYISTKVKNFQEKKQIIEAVEAQLRAEGRDRVKQIKTVQDFFRLTDGELKEITKGADYRTMPEDRFQGFLKEVENKAHDELKHQEALLEVNATIFEKELKKVDNLRQAMKLPTFENMTPQQLNEFNDLLSIYKTGDEFLGVRQLETISNTDISGIKTKREALEDLSKSTGIPVAELQQIRIHETDRFLYDTALARQNGLYSKMVTDVNVATIGANLRFHELKKELDTLVGAARASRKRKFMDKLVPTDQMIFDFLENTGDSKIQIAARMTPAELKAALFIQEKYATARDYLVEHGTLKKYRTDYITHVRRGFLEAWRESGKFRFSGFKKAIGEIFDTYKQDEAYFNIMNQKTGEVLPLEKFFQFSMKRSGNLVPTKNVAQAVEKYFMTFEKKVALDSFIPKIDIYAHALTPSKMTPRGLEYDDSIKRFTKEWMNTKKGRVLNELVKPGGKMDWSIRTGIAFTRIMDLGLNIPVGLASNFGAQVVTGVSLGAKKYATGLARSFTKSGREIAKKYESFVGETFLNKITDVSKNAGEKFHEAFFALFAVADRKAKVQFLLGSMTPQEFASKTISDKRLGEIRGEVGRYLSQTGDESIIGKTALGKSFTQYKSWAVPILQTTQSNIRKLTTMLKNKENPIHTKEFQELMRFTVLSTTIGLAVYGAYANLRDEKERTFAENLAFKSMNDAMSLIGAFDPATWARVPSRFLGFLSDLATSVSAVTSSLVSGERTVQEGKVKGLDKLQSIFTPSIVRQVDSLTPEPDEELDALIKSQKNAQEQVSDEATAKWEELKVLAATDKEAANEAFLKLEEENPDLADKVYDIGTTENLGLTDTDKKIKQLGVENGLRARYIYQEVSQLETKEEKNAYVTDLDNKGLISDEVYDQLAEMIKEGKPIFEENVEHSEEGVLQSVALYAKAIKTDPVTAFRDIFRREKILRVQGGAIIVERLPLSDSTKIKIERGATEEMRLDHTIPLQLGGHNGKRNLKLVPKEVWESYTPVENYLGRQLKNGTMNKKEVWDLIRRFKNGELTADDIIK